MTRKKSERDVGYSFLQGWGRATGGLSLEEKGAYAEIAICTIHRQSGLTDIEASRILGCSLRKWDRIKSSLLDRGAFVIDEDNKISIPATVNADKRVGQ